MNFERKHTMDDNAFSLPVELDRITVPTESAFDVFSAPDTSKIDPILANVRAHIDGFIPKRNVNTVAGRKEIASVAYKVAKAKGAIKEVGKKIAADAKEIPKRIDANRKHVEDTLDAWRDEVRKPLDDWEEAENARISAHNLRLAQIADAARLPHALPSGYIADRIALVEAVEISAMCEEFEDKYAEAKAAALAVLRPALESTRQQEAQAAELETLRKEAAARAERERQEQLAREAADKAREDERRRAQEEIAARERAARAEADAIEAKARAERDAAERRETELREQAEASERARQEAERKAAAAEQEARDKLAREKAAAKAEDDRRAADREHRGAINRRAVAALVAAGIDKEIATNVVTEIARGEIPNVTINY
jgi:peptidoglycan DL-endopeptidase RipA